MKARHTAQTFFAAGGKEVRVLSPVWNSLSTDELCPESEVSEGRVNRVEVVSGTLAGNCEIESLALFGTEVNTYYPNQF